MGPHSKAENLELSGLAPSIADSSPSGRWASFLRDLAAQALIGTLALAQGFSMRPILYLSQTHAHERTVLYGFLTLQWLTATLVVRAPGAGSLAILALCSFASLQYAPGAPPEFWPLWIGSLFVPLAARQLRKISFKGDFVFGRRFWRNLALGTSLSVFTFAAPWALVTTSVVVCFAYKSRLSVCLILLVGALGLDVFIGCLWCMHGCQPSEVGYFMTGCLLDSLEAWVMGLGFLGVVVLVMNHPRLGGMGNRLWAKHD